MPAPLIAIELAAKLGGYLKRYWPQLSAVCAIVFLFTTVRGCGKQADLQARLDACLSAPPVVQYQTVTVTAKAAQSVQIIYRNGSPCPDVLAVNNSESATSTHQEQKSGSESQLGTKLGVWSVALGAEYGLSGDWGGYAGAAWSPGPIGLEASLGYRKDASARLGLVWRP